MKKILLMLLCIPLLTIAQEKGVNFEHNTTWDKVKAKAKAENKHIFVDCFTTWCGPCKYMASNIFPQEKVGTFFNANFVNVKIQMDQTEGDNADVKTWYDEAKRFEKDYSVRAYPTFLIFDPNGELVHRIVGGGEADPFIAKAKDGLDPETQYITLVKKYEQNPSDADLAKKTAQAAMSAYDDELSSKALAKYIELVGTEKLLTPENIGFLLKGATSSSAPSYAVIRDNKAKVDALLLSIGKKEANADLILSSILTYELVLPKLNDKAADVDFAALKQSIEKDHPYVDMTVSIARAKAQYYAAAKNWPAFKDAVNEYIGAMTTDIQPSSLNSFAWSIFENCDDPACIQAALDWSKRTIEGDEADPAFLDTYANLLYKSGDKKNAITWQEKAVAKAGTEDKAAYTTTLDKMKKGEQTW